jgi:dTDP-4-dehydrorhamnose reductase
MRVLVAGSDGMLGRALVDVLEADGGFEVVATSRGREGAFGFDAMRDSPDGLLADAGCDWVINAIGMLASRIDSAQPAGVADAIAVNAVFPQRFAAAAEAAGCRLIHISSDGVFAPQGDPVDESAPPDAADLYGLTKRLGEPPAPAITLRCSIVGTEHGPARSLLGWALSQPRGAVIEGHTDRAWNGVTTLALARLCGAAIREPAGLPSPLHVVPADVLSKAELLALCLREFGREDVRVEPVASDSPRSRTLATGHDAEHERLWRSAGYDGPPPIAELVAELAAQHRVREA